MNLQGGMHSDAKVLQCTTHCECTISFYDSKTEIKITVVVFTGVFSGTIFITVIILCMLLLCQNGKALLLASKNASCYTENMKPYCSDVTVVNIAASNIPLIIFIKIKCFRRCYISFWSKSLLIAYVPIPILSIFM